MAEQYHPLPIPTYSDTGGENMAKMYQMGLAGMLAQQAAERQAQELALKQAEDARIAETHDLTVRQKKMELDKAKLDADVHKHMTATAGAVETGMPTLQDMLGAMAPGGTALRPGATAEGSAPLVGPQGNVPQLPGPPSPDQQQIKFAPPVTTPGVPEANLPSETMSAPMFALRDLVEQSRKQSVAKKIEEDKAISDGKSVRLKGDITGPDGKIIASAGDVVPTAVLTEYQKNGELTFHDAGDKLAAVTKGGTRVPGADIPKGRAPAEQINWDAIAQIKPDGSSPNTPGGTAPAPSLPSAPGGSTPGPNVSQSAWAPGDIGQGVTSDEAGNLIPPAEVPHGAHPYDVKEVAPSNLAPELKQGATNAIEPGRNVDTEFLGAQPRGKQILMKSVADYQQDTPQFLRPGRAGTSQEAADWAASMKRAFPDYDAREYPALSGYVKEVESTKSGVGRNVIALNTVTLHMGALNELSKDLATSGTPLNKVQAINRFVNFVRTSMMGKSEVTDFNTALNAVAGEMGNVFKQGTTTDPEIDKWKATISPNMSSDQIHGVVATGVDLLRKRLSVLEDDYKQKLGHAPRGGSFLHGGTADVLKQLESEYNAGKGNKDPNRLIRVGGKAVPFNQLSPQDQQEVLASGG